MKYALNKEQRIINGVRILLVAIIVFELLNWAGYLHFSLDFSWLGLIGTALILFVLLETIGFPWYVWCAALLGIVIDASSDIFHLYGAIGGWDRVVHVSGGALAGIVVLHGLFRLRAKGYLHFDNKLLIPLLIMTVSLMGFLYEYWEYMIDIWYFESPRALGDGADTVDDEMLNIVGAIAVGIGYYILTKKPWKRQQ